MLPSTTMGLLTARPLDGANANLGVTRRFDLSEFPADLAVQLGNDGGNAVAAEADNPGSAVAERAAVFVAATEQNSLKRHVLPKLTPQLKLVDELQVSNGGFRWKYFMTYPPGGLSRLGGYIRTRDWEGLAERVKRRVGVDEIKGFMPLISAKKQGKNTEDNEFGTPLLEDKGVED
nr:hypothetical protein Iba_chr01dCG13400 [Ipomoea batatas]